MTTFSELGLNENILKSVTSLGFEHPTSIQEKTIPRILESNDDLIALAETGTGKTAAFGLPLIQKMDAGDSNIQIIILCPIRELCLQITKDINSYITNSPGLKVTAVYGGYSIQRQSQEIKNRTNIIVGTPGRVKDLINRKVLNLKSIKYVVLDEADEMLDMGFKEDLDAILSATPATKRTLLFSATMPESVRRIASRYMNDPKEIRTGNENKGAEKVSHEYYSVHAKDRYEALRRILDSLPNVYGILFCRTRRETQEVASKLSRDNYRAGAISGDIAQAQRTKIMESFRNKEIHLLVATDVAARGIDVKGLTHIINYNLPDSDETYIHRSGRTGRADLTGISISIINTREGRRIRDIQRIVKKEFERKLVPSGEQICENQLFNIIENITKTEVDEDQIKAYLPKIYEKLSDLDKEELIKHVVSMEFNYFLNLYKGSRDLNASGGREERSDFRAGNFTAFKLNFGRIDNINVKDILTLINSKQELKGVEIGQIQLDQRESCFEIDEKYKDIIPKLFKKSNFKRRPIVMTSIASMPARNKKRFASRSSRAKSKSDGVKSSGFRGGGFKGKPRNSRSRSDKRYNPRRKY